jgi:hypothetical protein
MIHLRVDEALFDIEEARRNLFETDPQAQHGMTLFHEAEKLLDSGSPSVVAQR